MMATATDSWGGPALQFGRPKRILCCLPLGLLLAGCGGSSSIVKSAAAPSITTQPSNQAVSVGLTATFSVAASGTTPLTYQWQKGTTPDRKSTRLNSSHLGISYAVFCLKKKNTKS